MEPQAQEQFVLKIIGPAATGIVAAFTSYLAEQNCYIVEMAQFDDPYSQKFFMRTVFRFQKTDKSDSPEFRQGLDAVSQKLNMSWELFSFLKPPRVLIMVSKYDHCFNDLLYRFKKGELNMSIAAVVSNHLDLRPMAEREGIRFVHLPVNKDNKPRQEAELMKIVEEEAVDLVVLARYMQVLSDDLCRKLDGRAINIHHSFLPGFKGAKPYHQAYMRGVKLIGATAHYVTSNLDEGPIIEQEVTRVDHHHLPDDLVRIGRDNETVVLSRAVRFHLEHRIFLNNDRTVVFK
ncbi:formyltetrahydrofolate deformylase [Stenoxybacter acetivorans]|uniref:formyltetrahydrofolate deformylase n=1 Tax=Stenoxybacter acetivorans TaxID=422441 RepID=UPI00055F087F|nr:formyltetrahydrofolate deformylase [Stenoxybacter acetivorans]